MGSEIVFTFLTSVVSSSFVSCMIFWFVRTLIGEKLRAGIQHAYDQKLEAFKAEQDGIRAKEIERLRSDLHVVATEREIQFRGLQERRADVIARVFADLDEAHAALQIYTDDLRPEYPSDEELLKRLSKCFTALVDHFYPNVIYLPRDLADHIKELVITMKRLLQDAQVDRRVSSERPGMKFASIENRINQVKDELQKRMEELAEAFRNLLGDGATGK